MWVLLGGVLEQGLGKVLGASTWEFGLGPFCLGLGFRV